MMQTFAQAFVLCPTLAAIAADDKHLHQLTKEMTPPSTLPFGLIYYAKEITLTCPCTLLLPARLLFVHRFVYYSLYGKSFRNVEEVGVSSSSLIFNGVGWRGTGDRGGWSGSFNIPQCFR